MDTLLGALASGSATRELSLLGRLRTEPLKAVSDSEQGLIFVPQKHHWLLQMGGIQ